MIKIRITVLLFFISIFFIKITAQNFEPNWQSLKQYKVPEWYRDAKFGIFLHWGVASVPASENGWYGRQMYQQDSAEWGHTYAFHVKHYGHPSKFGYKDLIPLWKAEKWNPDALVKLFKKDGAKFIVPVAVHHDNFDNYASSYQPWNSVNMGPKKDIVGDWEKAIKQNGLYFGVSSHSDRSWDWMSTSHGSDNHGEFQGIPYDGNLTKADGKGKWWEGYDPQQLYSKAHTKNEAPDATYMDNWYKRTLELITKYKPDLLWFDGPMPMVCGTNACNQNRTTMEEYGLKIAANFYNDNIKNHNGKLEAVLNIKSWGAGTVPDSSCIVLDIEKGQTKDILPYPWQTDTSIPGDWYYNTQSLELSDTVLVHNLCDIVSKNGNLLLNVGLRADGTLPQNQIKILDGIGHWLKINGEAIYGTRPFTIFGEGGTTSEDGNFHQNNKPFSASDIRFTTKGNTLYALILGWPKSGIVTIKSLSKNNAITHKKITAINMLGTTEKIKWQQTSDGLKIFFPTNRYSNYAYVVKIK